MSERNPQRGQRDPRPALHSVRWTPNIFTVNFP